MKILLKKDGSGFLAEVEGQENIFAYGDTEDKARYELLQVVEMMMDYHQEEVEKEKIIRDTLISQS